uniref:Uncharacterized protein n=1 Tax=Arundo donax TaxID=35708 RepID=A0A0A9F0H6_ARUDO
MTRQHCVHLVLEMVMSFILLSISPLTTARARVFPKTTRHHLTEGQGLRWMIAGQGICWMI